MSSQSSGYNYNQATATATGAGHWDMHSSSGDPVDSGHSRECGLSTFKMYHRHISTFHSRAHVCTAEAQCGAVEPCNKPIRPGCNGTLITRPSLNYPENYLPVHTKDAGRTSSIEHQYRDRRCPRAGILRRRQSGCSGPLHIKYSYRG